MSEDDSASILKKVGDTYKRVSTYRDAGYVKTFRTQRSGGELPKLKFSTIFKAPNLFRYEFRDRFFEDEDESLKIVWSTGEGIFIQEDDGSVRVIQEFSTAPSGSLTVSKDCAPPVLRLLVQTISGPVFTEMPGANYIGDEIVDSKSCHHFTRTLVHPTGPRETDFWISKARRVLIKSREAVLIDPARFAVVYDQLLSDHNYSEINTELKVDAVRSAMDRVVNELTRGAMEDWKRERLVRSIESCLVVQETLYTDIELDSEVPNSSFNAPDL